MTDPEDKSGRHRDWASKIPLMTLLAIVFAAGGVFVKQQFVESKISAVVDRFDGYVKVSDARLRIVEDWKTQVEAARMTEERIERDRRREERQREERKRK